MLDASPSRLRQALCLLRPLAVSQAPGVGAVVAGVAGEEDELVGDRIEGETPVLAFGRGDTRVHLRPLRSIPLPELVRVDLRLLQAVHDEFQPAEQPDR